MRMLLLLFAACLVWGQDKPLPPSQFRSHPLSAEQKLRVKDLQLAECRAVAQRLSVQVQALQQLLAVKDLSEVERTALSAFRDYATSTRPKNCERCDLNLEVLEWREPKK